ncbi:unnamed protein product [Blepharisma stoltei]|uniref:Uncharacterized protein n=1 Tax=Blepharisma stoltei TaxID=1481888 RepID=A0AAU9I7H9_9CILI|nr:unnamed protein product [Blepharisma stoltei]
MGLSNSKDSHSEVNSGVTSQLSEALRTSNSSRIREIITENNININELVFTVNDIEMTPLMYVAAFDKAKLIPYLVREMHADVNRDYKGNTVLTFCIINNLSAGFYETVQMQETNLNQCTSQGKYAIVEASRQGKDPAYFIGLANKGASCEPLRNLPGSFQMIREALEHLPNSNN